MDLRRIELTSEAAMEPRSRPQHGKRHPRICPTAPLAGLAQVCRRANEAKELIMNETPVSLAPVSPVERLLSEYRNWNKSYIQDCSPRVYPI